MRGAWVVATLCLVACGGRSGLGTGFWTPPGSKDGAVSDQGTPRDDLRRRDGRWPLDLVQPRDRTSKDACLPIPASKVQGSYHGKWEGIWKCSGDKGTSINGTLQFTLTPAGSPDSFKVSGGMNGKVLGGVPFGTPIEGSMGCTSLHAKLPKIVVGSGALIYQLTGTLSGLFVAKPVRSFTSGSWTAKEMGGKCWAQGSWTAQHL